jgi:2-methylcitrate dehydratase PrpD
MASETKMDGLTRYVARFIDETAFQDIPDGVVALGKKSILDGLGLAFAGSVAQSAKLVRAHLDSLSLGEGKATQIGGGRKIAPRFAAFANGIAIHADDYDDTQLAVAETRVYGLLTHPTAPALPAALAMGEELGSSGQAVMPISSASN